MGDLTVDRIQSALGDLDLGLPGVLLACTDHFILAANLLTGLRHWRGSRHFACTDLHHGSRPIETLAAYLDEDPHDAVLPSFSPALVQLVIKWLRNPVRSLLPIFFVTTTRPCR